MDHTNEMHLIFDSRSSKEKYIISVSGAERKNRRFLWKLKILEKVSKMLKRQWNHFLQQKRKRNDPEWDFPLWKHLWIVWKWNLH